MVYQQDLHLDLHQHIWTEPLWWWAMARCVGAPQLVYGSDRPVIEPMAARRDAALRANGAGLLASAGGVA
jgi:hypothetical protein